MSVIVQDAFAALGTGEVNGWTPDTVNTPGNDWVGAPGSGADGDGGFVGNGSGAIVAQADDDTIRLDVGTGTHRVDFDINAGGDTGNKYQVVAAHNDDGHMQNGGSGTGYHLHVNFNSTTMRIWRYDNGSRSSIGTAETLPFDENTTGKCGLEVDGTNVISYHDDTEIDSVEDNTHSGTFVGFRHAGLGTVFGTVDNALVNDLAAGGANPKGPFGLPLHGPFGGPI